MNSRQVLKYLLFVIAELVLSCNRNPYKITNRTYKKQSKVFARRIKQYPLRDSVTNAPYFAGTTNFSIRRPNFIIIHHTAQNTCDQTLKTFTLRRTQVSAHYVICRDGTVFHMLNDMLRGHHAGVSKWGNDADLNSSSIGIELDNNGFEPFTEMQINSLLELLDRLKRAYNIPAANFMGHADVAPGRKVDPNVYFPWQMLAEKGFGLWYDTVGVTVPDNFDPMQALRIIGYNIKDSASAVYSYKIHFVKGDTTRTINDYDRKILYDLARKYE